jgi:hypothetical protein
VEKLTPRSYVTGGFDIIKPSLIDFIAKTLRKTGKTWWHDYIYTKLKKNNNSICTTGTTKDLYNLFDELLCLKAILYNEDIFIKPLKHDGLEKIKYLNKIRNDWAHAPGKGMIENEADDAFQVMIELMEIIDEEAIDRLFSIKDQMHRYYYDDRKIIASKENLINFLEHKVLFLVINDERETKNVKEAKRKALHTKQFFDKMKTSEEVVNFFWNNIVNNPRGLDSHRVFRECGLTTFEDVRIEFNFLCYGE